MKKDIWSKCLNCKVNCCLQKDVAFPLFLMKEERERVKGINKKFPCKFLNKNKLCDIHKDRPIDCRLYPFDILKINSRFHWVIWDTICPISKAKSAKLFEPFLKQHEKKLMPKFRKYMEEYSEHKINKFIQNYKLTILREVRA